MEYVSCLVFGESNPTHEDAIRELFLWLRVIVLKWLIQIPVVNLQGNCIFTAQSSLCEVRLSDGFLFSLF